MMKVLNENARGYICLDCNNSKLFDGTSDLYRLYKPVSEKYYDFDNEIACPYTMSCHECSSRNIGIEIRPGEIIKSHKVTDGHGIWLVGEKWLLNVSDADDLKDLIRIIVESEGENRSDDLYNHLMEHGFHDWEWDEEIFSECGFSLALVNIVSSGIIRQDEYGLGDEDSSYDNARYIGIY